MTLQSLVGTIIGLINYVIPVFITLTLVIFFWGVVKYVYKAGDAHGKDADKQVIVWGLVALFVLVSLWGIVGLLCQSFFDSSSCRAPQGSTGGSSWSQTP